MHLAPLPVADSSRQSAILDFIETEERRHGVRITPQGEKPIPAWDGLKLD